MIVRLVWAIIPLVFFSIVGIQDSLAESKVSVLDGLFPTDKHEDLKLTIETDKIQYFDGDLVYINWVAENVGTKPFPFTGSFDCGDAISLGLESGFKQYRQNQLRLEGNSPNEFCSSRLSELIEHGTLEPGQSIDGSIIWNQLAYNGYKIDDARPDPGYYNLKIGLDGVRNCKEIQLVGDSPLYPKPELPNDFKEIILGNTKNIPIKYHITGGELTSANVYYYDDHPKSANNMYLLFNLEPVTAGTLILDIPDPLIQKNFFSGSAKMNYNIVVDGINVSDEIEIIDNCNSDTLVIYFETNTKQVGLQGNSYDYTRTSDDPILLPFSRPPCWWAGECLVPSEFDEDVIITNTIRVTKDGTNPKECGISENDLKLYGTPYGKTILENVCVYPKKIIVKPGDTVFWESTSQGEGGHLHAADVRWLEKSIYVMENYPFNFTFNEPGTYYYSVRGPDLVQKDIGWILVTENQEAIDNAKDISSITIPDKEFNNTSIPPKKQLELGNTPDKITCKDGLEKIFKYDGSPACVKPETAQKLIERGWAV